MATTTGKTPGRKPKGKRSAVTVRVPEDQKPLLEAQARKAGLPLGDYIAKILAEHHEYPVPGYLTQHQEKGQPQLQFSA